MKDLIKKYPFLKTILSFILGAIATYFGITSELPVNYTGVTPKVDSAQVIVDTLKIDTTNAE